jgi:hypothetical protein
MSDNAVLAAFRRSGIESDEMSGHGFRAMARTILDEVLGFRADIIDHQLAHAVRDPNGRAYNRTAHLPDRKRMMQDWADYLDKLKADVKVLPFKQAEGACPRKRSHPSALPPGASTSSSDIRTTILRAPCPLWSSCEHARPKSRQ